MESTFTKSPLNRLFGKHSFTRLFCQHMVLYHRIDPGSVSENFAAWTNSCLSEIYFCNKWICLCFCRNHKKTPNLSASLIKTVGLGRFPNIYHSSEKPRVFLTVICTHGGILEMEAVDYKSHIQGSGVHR